MSGAQERQVGDEVPRSDHRRPMLFLAVGSRVMGSAEAHRVPDVERLPAIDQGGDVVDVLRGSPRRQTALAESPVPPERFPSHAPPGAGVSRVHRYTAISVSTCASARYDSAAKLTA